MIDSGSLSAVPMIDFFASGVSTCSSVLLRASSPGYGRSSAIALRGRSASRSRCACARARSPACGRLRADHAPELRFGGSHREPLEVQRRLVLVLDAEDLACRRTTSSPPCPPGLIESRDAHLPRCRWSARTRTLAVFAQAFMCSRMRVCRSLGALSRNLTVSFLPAAGHRYARTMVSLRAPPRRPIGVRIVSRCVAAFAGLVSIATFAASAARDGGRYLGTQA